VCQTFHAVFSDTNSIYVLIEIIDISVEAVCVFVFTFLKDLEMFDEVTDTPTVARTSNLNEELGQVSLFTLFIY